MVTQASPEERTVIACARTCTLLTNVVTAPISTIGSGKFSEYKALSINWSISSDGICTIDENMDLGTLRALQFQLTPIYIYFEEAATESTIVYYGQAIITNVQTSGAYNDVENYSIQLQGTGELINSASLRIIMIQPDTPSDGQTTLTFDFDQYPNATAYTIRIRDITAGTLINDTASIPPRIEIIDSTHDYAFAYRPEFATGPGNWSPEIFFGATISANFLIDSDGAFIINSDGNNILTS